MPNEIIGAKRVWVEILEDLTQGIIWDWIYFMRHSGADPQWVAKSDQELSEELWVSPYHIKKCRERLVELGWIKTRIRRWAGAPTMHYQVQEEVVEKVLRVYQLLEGGSDLESLIIKNLGMDYQKFDSPLSKIAESLTSLTTSLDLNMIKKGGQADFSDLEPEDIAIGEPVQLDLGAVINRYEQEIGPITPLIRDSLLVLMDDYPEQWILEALGLCAQYNKRSLKYAEAILKNWERDGRGAKIESEGGDPQQGPRMSLEEFNQLSSYQEETDDKT